MRWQARAWLAVVLAIALYMAALPLLAADPCSGFAWEVSRERALFATSALSMAAGADSASAPVLLPERLYALQLQPLSKVIFLTAPGKSMPADGSYAGLAALRISTPGIYRISVDVPYWIDVVADGGLMSAKGFQGAPGCNAPHKIVEFDFPLARQLMLQFSGPASASIRVSISAASGR
jgi:hypothetical protein